MDIITLLILAISPSLAIIYYIYNKDKFDKEPRHLLIKSFFLGVFSIAPAIILETKFGDMFPIIERDIMSVIVFAFIIVGLSEELSKFAFLRLFAYPKKEFNEPYDGIMYAIMVGMGFATIENIMYVFGERGGVGIAIIRMLTAIPAHAVFGIIMGYFIGISKTKSNGWPTMQYQGIGVLMAMLFHGCYDFFLLQENYPLLGLLSIVVIFIGITVSKRAIHLHVKASPFKEKKKIIKV